MIRKIEFTNENLRYISNNVITEAFNRDFAANKLELFVSFQLRKKNNQIYLANLLFKICSLKNRNIKTLEISNAKKVGLRLKSWNKNH